MKLLRFIYRGERWSVYVMCIDINIEEISTRVWHMERIIGFDERRVKILVSHDDHPPLDFFF